MNIAVVVVCLLSSVVAAYPSNTYKDLDICNHWNGRRHFLELGERGELHARNVTTSAYRVGYFETLLFAIWIIKRHQTIFQNFPEYPVFIGLINFLSILGQWSDGWCQHQFKWCQQCLETPFQFGFLVSVQPGVGHLCRMCHTHHRHLCQLLQDL